MISRVRIGKFDFILSVFCNLLIMKIIYLCLFLLLFSYNAFCQQGWAMLRGEATAYHMVTGQIKQSHRNNTPALKDGITWAVNGKLYLYGNTRYSYGGMITFPTLDMWSFDTLTSIWTWLSGKNHDSITQHGNSFLLASYGTKGVAGPDVTPGYNQEAVTWVLNGKLYMYGGKNNTTMTSAKGDLWMYDPTTNYWTWLDGGNYLSQHAIYGTRGVPNAVNHPGGIINALSWVRNGKLYMYGGAGYDSLNFGLLNDLWEYDPTSGYWTWLKGDRMVNSKGAFGTKGVASSSNNPPHSVKGGWYLNNKFYAYSTKGDDLWSYDHVTSNWTWLKGDTTINPPNFGSKNISHSSNTPGYGHPKSTWVWNNKLYLYGDNLGNGGAIWEYNPAVGNWTWVNGDSIKNGRTDWGIYQFADTNAFPRGMLLPNTWQQGNKTYCMFYRYSDAIWEYDNITKKWRWIKGMYNGWSNVYYIMPYRNHELNEPQAFKPDKYLKPTHNIWQIGDTVYTYLTDSLSNILWRYDLNTDLWAPMNFTYSLYPKCVAKGVGNVMNTPGYRDGYGTARIGNKLYLFGGRIYTESSPSWGGRSNQLWEYDLVTKVWTMLHGSDTLNLGPTYGTKNVGHADNTPGGISHPVFWAHNNKLFLYPGRSFDSLPNSVWEYDLQANNWKYIKGNAYADVPVHGQKGIATPNNHPGARYDVGYCYYNGRLYLFGGYGYERVGVTLDALNDLWEFDHSTNNWRWLTGAAVQNASTIFGTKKVAAATNTPGRREYPVMAATNGKLYLLGGTGTHGNNDILTGSIQLGDMWEYDTTSHYWKWIDGTQNEVVESKYERVAEFDTLNKFGGYLFHASMFSYKSRLYIFGGTVRPANMDTTLQWWTATNAMWCYETCNNINQCYSDTPIIKLDRVVTMCGRPVQLNAGNVWGKYLWSTGDTTRRIIITSPGTYWVRVTNPVGISAVDTVDVVQGAAIPINLGPDTLICDNDSLLLNPGVTTASFLWNTGDTTATIYGKNGRYDVYAVYSNGCFAYDSITITTKPAPLKPVLINNGPLCTGDTLQITDSTAVSRNRSGYYKSGIHTGASTGSYIENNVLRSDSGVYYLVDTLDGCISFDTTHVRVDSAYIPIVIVSLMPGNNVGPYTKLTFSTVINYGADSSSLQWYKNGNIIPGETNIQYITATQTDLLTGDLVCVRLNTSHRCVVVDTASGCAQNIIVNLSVNDTDSTESVNVYPNPVCDNLFITNIEEEGSVLTIYDYCGREIRKKVLITPREVINVESLPAGIYMVEIFVSGIEPTYFKVVKK